nr:OmpA family protein [Hydrogenophilus thiooxidans]
MSQLEAGSGGAVSAAALNPLPHSASAPSCAGNGCVPLSLYFELDKDQLSATEREKLRAWALAAKAQPGMIVIAAHTDRSASTRYNDALAERRLRHVLGLLAAEGIGRDRIVEARAYGERRVPVPTPDGVVEARNRVVEVWLLSR